MVFEGGDPRRPYVVGALWNGSDAPPESMDGSGENNIRAIHSRVGHPHQCWTTPTARSR